MNYTLANVPATICKAMNIPLMEGAETQPINEVIDLLKGETVERCLFFSPDAVGAWIFDKYPQYTEKLMDVYALKQPLSSVMPSVTPVCFGTMYTGVEPSVHGIQSYVKPVIKTDSVFDAIIRAGKKPCIVSTGNDSMSKIFLERNMDYFIVETPDEANEKAIELIKEDKYDFIAVYNGNYDGTMHKFGPEHENSINALKHNVNAFKNLAEAVKENWKNHNTLIGFAPDHGCHEIDGECGSHGLEMPEDMNIIHFYGVI